MSATSTPAPLRPWLRQVCPVAAVEDALLLLTTGRVDMARVVLERLPALLARAERERLLAENEELRGRIERAEAAVVQHRTLQARLARLARELADVRGTLTAARQPRAKPRAKPHQTLAAVLAEGRTTAERVADLLKVVPRHVLEIAGGRVGLVPSAWKRVMAELEVDTP